MKGIAVLHSQPGFLQKIKSSFSQYEIYLCKEFTKECITFCDEQAILLILDERVGVPVNWLKSVLSSQYSPVVIYIGPDSADSATKMYKLGVTEYVIDTQPQRHVLHLTVNLLFRYESARNELNLYKKIIGQHKAICLLRRELKFLESTFIPCLIIGEKGVGKKHAIRSVYENISAGRKKFVTINCGYSQSVQNFFTQLQDGTLFRLYDYLLFHLINLHKMPQRQQEELDEILDTLVCENIAGKTRYHIFSSIEASKSDYSDESYLIPALYYKLATKKIIIPPLREREHDIPLLIHYFLFKTKHCLHPYAVDALLEYPWPGNIEELQHKLKEAQRNAEDKYVVIQDFSFNLDICIAKVSI